MFDFSEHPPTPATPDQLDKLTKPLDQDEIARRLKQLRRDLESLSLGIDLTILGNVCAVLGLTVGETQEVLDPKTYNLFFPPIPPVHLEAKGEEESRAEASPTIKCRKCSKQFGLGTIRLRCECGTLETWKQAIARLQCVLAIARGALLPGYPDTIEEETHA